MKHITAFLQKYLLVWPMFAVFGVCLFLGDGKQTMVDVVGIGFVITLYIFTHFFLSKQREMTKRHTVLWLILLCYLLVRTFFSDDVGYSAFTTLRYVDAALLYYIFYSYSTDKSTNMFTHLILIFSVFTLGCSIIAMLFPTQFSLLPPMNLITSTYGHNHVVDVLLVGYAIALVLWTQTKKRIYLLLLLLFVAGTIFSLARAALLFEAGAILLAMLFARIKKNNIDAHFVILCTCITLLAIAAAFIPYKNIQKTFTFLPQYEKRNDYIIQRTEYVKQSLQSIKQYPVFGTGPGTFYLVSKHYQNEPNKYSLFAHNYILETTVEIGFVGILLILLMFVVPFYKKRLKQKDIPLAIAASIIFLYGLFDYSMNYLIVWFLFWSLIGMLNCNTSLKPKFVQKTPPLTIQFALLLSILGYISLLSAFLFDWSPTKPLLFDTTQKNNSEKKLINEKTMLMHKKNAEVLFAIGAFEKASAYDPQNTTYFHEYIREYRILHGSEQALKKIVFRTERITPKNKQIIQVIDVAIPSIQQFYSQELLNTVTDQGSPKEYLSKTYYFLGLAMLDIYPETTRSLWTLAKNISPGWGHFHVELASLESYIFQDEQKAIDILTECQKYNFPSEQCKDAIPTLSKPGALKQYIQNIPSTNL